MIFLGTAPLAAMVVAPSATTSSGAVGAVVLAGMPTAGIAPLTGRTAPAGALLAFGPTSGAPLAGFSSPATYVVRPPHRIFALLDTPEEYPASPRYYLRADASRAVRPSRALYLFEHNEPNPLYRSLRFVPAIIFAGEFPIVWVNT